MSEQKREGWTWLQNSPKWHYFVDYTSLCGKWMLLATGALEQGMDSSPDNCATCKKKKAARDKARATARATAVPQDTPQP